MRLRIGARDEVHQNTDVVALHVHDLPQQLGDIRSFLVEPRGALQKARLQYAMSAQIAPHALPVIAAGIDVKRRLVYCSAHGGELILQRFCSRLLLFGDAAERLGDSWIRRAVRVVEDLRGQAIELAVAFVQEVDGIVRVAMAVRVWPEDALDFFKQSRQLWSPVRRR